MSSFLAPLRTYLAGLSPRESWLLILGACLLSAIVFDLFLIRPISARAELAQAKTAQLDCDVAGLYGEQYVEFLQTPASAFLADGSQVTVFKGRSLPA